MDWYDASIGKSLSVGADGIDVPVSSRGIYVGVLGENNRHIIPAQSSFRYTQDLYNINYTAIPLN